MTPTATTPPQPTSVSDVLQKRIDVGRPDVSGPLAVYPVYYKRPRLRYIAFGPAGELVAITEQKGGASVNDLTVENKGDAAVLLYEGQELIGAQQNRVLDISVLVAPKSVTKIPVSCVEAGRWDGSRRHERFRPSPQAADPELRRVKQTRVRENARRGMEPRAIQSEVWEHVARRGAEVGTSSATGAMSDIFEQHRDPLGQLRSAVRRHHRQCGAVVAIDGEIVAMDFVGDSEVWKHLHDALVEGYALDALRRGKRTEHPKRAPIEEIWDFASRAANARAESRRPGIGIGENIHFGDEAVTGSALISDGELVQLTAYPDAGGGEGEAEAAPHRPGRVARPSQRRR